MKTLTVKFTFTIMPDEFGLYSLHAEAVKWIKAQREDCDLNTVAVMEVLPVEDAPTPGGLTQVRKRTRGPNKPKPPANGAGAEVAQGAGEGT